MFHLDNFSDPFTSTDRPAGQSGVLAKQRVLEETYRSACQNRKCTRILVEDPRTGQFIDLFELSLRSGDTPQALRERVRKLFADQPVRPKARGTFPMLKDRRH